MRLPSLVLTLTVGLALGIATSVAAGPQARVIGTVATADGNPIAGAVVTITCAALPTFSKELTSGDDGGYRVLLLDATQTYVFRVEAPGFVAHEEEVKVPVGTTDNERNFTLVTPAAAASGRQADLLEQPGYRELERGVGLEREGRLAEARASYREATEARPDLVVAWEVLVKMDYKLDDHQAVLEHARRCLELDDESLTCLAAAANSAKALGDEGAYEGFIDRYNRLNPEDPAAVFNQAVPMLQAFDDEGARGLLERCLELDPAFPPCLYEYGMLLLRAGDMATAKAIFERYLEAAPEGPEAATVRETLKYL